ncbi:hypothetical protein [Desulfogranum japonicum]|uniref:hypothetical protein n=1 Tax=Desulfogranum japonicum TaxID=231447 RepID=UPI0004066E79|nr:hypothetical protein [Desulfogranum japonicum]
MDAQISRELVNILKKNEISDYENAFERAFELTKAYASSSNAQASAIPTVFEKLFELFVTGEIQG